jgi:hypothetical protein
VSGTLAPYARQIASVPFDDGPHDVRFARQGRSVHKHSCRESTLGKYPLHQFAAFRRDHSLSKLEPPLTPKRQAAVVAGCFARQLRVAGIMGARLDPGCCAAPITSDRRPDLRPSAVAARSLQAVSSCEAAILEFKPDSWALA